MPGLVPGIHVLFDIATKQDVDGRAKPSYDGFLRIEPHFAPGLVGPLAAEFDAVVQAERAVVPELEPLWRNAPAAPARRPRHLADDVLGGDQRDRLLERKAAFQRLRLLAGPGADLGLFWPGDKILVRFLVGHRRHGPADAHLTSQGLPV